MAGELITSVQLAMARQSLLGVSAASAHDSSLLVTTRRTAGQHLAVMSASDQLNQLEKHCLDLEQQAEELKNRSNDSQLSTDDELNALQVENFKLKFRVEILKRSIEEELELHKKIGIDSKEAVTSFESVPGMESILHKLRELFKSAINKAFPEIDAPVLVTKSEKADYQCNSALPIAKMVGDKKLKPQDIAKKIIENMPHSNLIGELSVAGPGFINLNLNNVYVFDKIRDILVNGVKIIYKHDPSDRIIVDYSSPNIAKEMHVGHLRTTIIGDSVARIFEFVGYDVLRLNHIGDWGTQFGMLLAHLIETYPNYKTNPPPISDLQAFYKESKKRFDDDEEFKKRAYSMVVRLQAKDPEMISAWQQICDISRKEFKIVYDILNISPLLTERGESFYHDLMQGVVKYLEEKKLLIEEEGRKVMFSGENLPPLTIVKSDGGFTYDTSDMAALRHRVEVEKATRIIYVVDQGQSQHFQILFKCGAVAGFYDPKKVRLDHLAFGVVLGEDKKRLKTRSGETVRLKNLIDEGLERARLKLVEKERDKILTEEELKAAQEAVAIGCIKYSDLNHDRTHDYVFSFDRMLDDRGNTAVYLLYTVTRIRSIIRNAKLEVPVEELAKQNLSIEFDHPREIKLTKFILKFPEVILQILDDLYIHSLCTFLYDLSVVFSEFYEQCYCVVKTKTDDGETLKVNLNRIFLCEATVKVMETGLYLLGIKTVGKM